MAQADQQPLVTYELIDGIAHIGLNRPEKRNAVSDRVIDALSAAIDKADREAKAGVLFGAGNHFCAGLDLAEHAERTPIEGIRNSRGWHAVFAKIEFGMIPWVSALHGAVVGGGLELAASTHIRVADKTAFFALPEGQRGIFVGGGGSVRIQRLMGTARMMDLMLTGRSLNAEEAERANLAQYIVEAGTARDKATELAKKAASNAELSNYAVIHALPRIQNMSREDGLFTESFVASFTTTTDEAKERLQAFLEKRAAKVHNPNGGNA